MKFIPIIILFLTCYTSCEASQTGTYLIPNVLILPVNESMSTVKLSCGNHSGVISWKHNGNPMKEHGDQITTVLKLFDEANYTCHSETGNVLNYTLVLQQGIGFRNKILVKSESSDYILCSAKNFDGKFQCTWQLERKEAKCIHFTVARLSGGSENITCSLNGSTLSCEDKSHCPYAEEPSRISMSAYFRSYSRFEEYHRQFFISEIVKPEKVIITKVEDHTFKWEYPETWSKPPCYFQLIFQVKVVKPNDPCVPETHNKTINVMEFTVPKKYRKSYKLCVRAQEEASNSLWSDWSSYKVTPGK
ncbi:interleukin-12 subunit beta isoform X2 [Clupea harengus]|uniref:Interleukin-12 subunit beta n=1 Tax=Clupea harengus TaxID=7950 RepID=A0A6P8FVP3_CLUHA|nr:interleukin-12 subunit beta isoform X2 [Clupea harengus]